MATGSLGESHPDSEATPKVGSLADLVLRARSLVGRAAAGERAVLGIAGAPGVGKTTLARTLVAALAADPPGGASSTWVVHAPMDGFHLADVELERLGRRDRKGAPDTFDVAGYAAALRRLRVPEDETVYLPAFDRTVEQPVAGSVPVFPETRIVVTEGNYLLLDTAPWPSVRAALDEVWFCVGDDELRRERLVRRHVEFGKSADAASTWVERSDEANARMMAATVERADLVVPME